VAILEAFASHLEPCSILFYARNTNHIIQGKNGYGSGNVDDEHIRLSGQASDEGDSTVEVTCVKRETSYRMVATNRVRKGDKDSQDGNNEEEK